MKRFRGNEDVIEIDIEPEALMQNAIVPVNGGGSDAGSRGVGESLYNQLNPKQKAALTRFVKSRGRKKYARRNYRSYGRRSYARRGYSGGNSNPISIVQGRGDYTLGGQVGARIGGYLGDRVHNFVSGFGDYHSAAELYGRLPTMVNQPSGGGTIIRFQEYITDVVTSSTPGLFELKSFELNPGKTGTFPWLAQIASNFEQYQFEGIIFQFRSTSANALNSTNTALGTVIMATQYDSVDGPFTSKAEMLNYEYSVSVKPSESCLHMIECASNQTTIDKLYVLEGSVPPNADPRLYNLGRFSIATQGFQGASVNIGELHVTYQVRLLKPKLFQALGNDVDTYYSFFETTTGTPWDNSNPLGLSQIVWDSNLCNNFGIIRNGTQIRLPYSAIQKQYEIFVRWEGSILALTAIPGVSIGGGVFVTPAQGSPNTGVSAGRMTYQRCFRSFGNTEVVLTFNTAGVLPTGATCNLTVSITQVAFF